MNSIIEANAPDIVVYCKNGTAVTHASTGRFKLNGQLYPLKMEKVLNSSFVE